MVKLESHENNALYCNALSVNISWFNVNKNCWEKAAVTRVMQK